MEFKASNQTVKTVIFGADHFQIPRYQRPYAWGEDEVSDFWNDLVTSEEPYFFGSFIFNNEFRETKGLIDIIDGQQRFLTITIFSSVLRDIADNYDTGFADLIQRKDIIFEDQDGNQTERVTPGLTTQEFFYKRVQTRGPLTEILSPKTTEERKIQKVYDLLFERVKIELSRFSSDEDKINALRKLRNKVYGLIVIKVEIDSEEDAYEIFETTNARGVDLSVSDLLKNLIFKKIPQKGELDFAKDRWIEITNYVEDSNTELKRFLRYHWLSKHSFVTEKSLFREIKRKTKDWDALLTDLWIDSENWNKLLAGSSQDFVNYGGANIFKSVFAIKLMSVTQCYVFLLSVFRNFHELPNPRHIIKVIEKFTFQYSAVSKRPGNLVERIYSRYAIELDKAVCNNEDKKKRLIEVQKIFSALENELKKNLPSREVFLDQFTSLSYKHSEKGRTLIKYILSNINDDFQETQEHMINFDQVNIEHILPQNPSKEWRLTKTKIKPYVNLLGNLTLLSKQINSRVQNKSIEKKLPDLKESTLPITQHLVEFIEESNGEWSEDSINSRQRKFGEIALDKIWHF